MMSFWRMPERLYDDPDELAVWAEQALAVARRSGKARPQPTARVQRNTRKKRPTL